MCCVLKSHRTNDTHFKWALVFYVVWPVLCPTGGATAIRDRSFILSKNNDGYRSNNIHMDLNVLPVFSTRTLHFNCLCGGYNGVADQIRCVKNVDTDLM